MGRMKQWVKKIGARALAGRILLWAGVAIVAAGAVYEGANLPWRAMMIDWGLISDPGEPPDPAPLANAAWAKASAGGEAVSPAMPEREKRFLTKGEVQLELYGYLKIPKLGVSENVVEGSGTELCYAVGHIPGTALPGQTGNSVLPGHRNYIPMHPFRNLDQLEAGDTVIFEDAYNKYTYEVFEALEVGPEEVWVLDPVEGEDVVLTLLTCTPVTTMTRRLAVRARLISTGALPEL